MHSEDKTHPRLSANVGAARREPVTLEALGWNWFFAQQTNAQAMSDKPPVRVVAVHRSGLQVVGVGTDEMIPPRADVAVGDWLLLDRARPRASHVLSRYQTLINEARREHIERQSGTDLETTLRRVLREELTAASS